MADDGARGEADAERDKGPGPDEVFVMDYPDHPGANPFAAAVRATRMPMIICDAKKPDLPIIYANAAFLAATGYSAGEIAGQNCRFLQGPDTDRDEVRRVSEAIRNKRDIHVELLNYRRDGSTFWNSLYVSPVSNGAGETLFFFGSQMDVTGRVEADLRIRAEKAAIEAAVVERTGSLQQALDRQNTLLHEVDHRVKNNLQTIAALIAMEARGVSDDTCRAAFSRLTRRVEAVATVHRRFYEENEVDRFDVVGFARALVEQLGAALPVTFRTELPDVPILVTAAQASPIALILNELLLEAAAGGSEVMLRIARDAADPARFQLTVSPLSDEAAVLAASGGAGPPSMVGRLARQLRGTLHRGDAQATVALPCDSPA